MITAKTVESTFRSKWFKKKGKITIKIRRNGRQGVNILIDIDGQNFVETLWGIPWKTAAMLIGNPGRTADIVLFEECCLVADGEIWFLKDEGDKFTVWCKTAEDYRSGMSLAKNLSKEEMVHLINIEPPF